MESRMFLHYYADYQRTIKGSLQEPFMVLQEGLHLESFLKGFT